MKNEENENVQLVTGVISLVLVVIGLYYLIF